MRRAAAVGCALGLLAAPAVVAAQDVSVLLGGVHARYADSVTGTAGLISARFGAAAKRTAGVLDASFSRFATGETAIQFGGQAVHAWRVSRAASLGLVGFGSFGAFDGGSRSGTLAAGPAVLLGAGRMGGSLRFAGGAVERVDGGRLSLLTADARLDTRISQALTLTVRTGATRADQVRFVDVGGEISLSRGFARLESGIGLRAGDLRDNPEWHVRLSLQATPGTVFEAAAGAYPRDISGFNSGGFASVGFRVRVPARVPVPLRRGVAVQRLGAERVRVSISFPQARQVAIAGEWNAWTPAALSRNGSRWIIDLGLRPGVYRFSLLVNGDRWTVPDDVAAVPDDFGGKAALLVVPP